ncbi:ATP-binding protein [Natronosalvus caseinilyticus]|uniref:ATP-binding protein n=1 Tax=Natronosalvus caseinilyticus TaxID=2953747 RepID=UPI0028A64690|nr:DUF87 domain-containing protein [Natronosalvus caseinilyticus]
MGEETEPSSETTSQGDLETAADSDDRPPETSKENETTDSSLEETPRSRTYLEIRPSTNSLEYGAVAQAMELLYRRLEDRTATGVLNSLRGRSNTPVVEMLLVSDGHTDTSIRYRIGTTDDDFLDDLEGICRTVVPNSYELTRVEWHPRDLEVVLNAPDSELDTGSDERVSTSDPFVAGVEYRGRAQLRRDWLMPFRSFDELGTRSSTRSRQEPRHADSPRVPLATLVETLCESDVPVIYQVVCRPAGSLQPLADEYRFELESEVVTSGDRLSEFLFPRPAPEERTEPREVTPAYRDRLEALEHRDHRHAFQASARAVVLSRDDPETVTKVAHNLAGALSHLSGDFHEIAGHVVTDDDFHTGLTPPGTHLYETLIDRTCLEPTYDELGNRFPWKSHESSGIVVSATELPVFCLLDGGGLTARGQRALEARHAERTGLPLPAPQQLARYTGAGQALCRPLTDDRQPAGERFVLPPELQDRHLFIVGDTGSGKSVLTAGAMLSNTTATAGPEILFDYKGGGTAEEYLQAHYAAAGGLDADTVQYFDLTKMLPALSLFDIGPLLDAGLSREEARSRIAGHYEEILAGLLGEEQYYSATESTKAIRNHLRALYDPIHGSDAISHKDLYSTLQRTLSDRTPPPTSDERLTEYFAGLLERDRDVFNMVLGGAVARVETIATDDRLAPLFDYVHLEDPDVEHEDSAQDAGRELRSEEAIQIKSERDSDQIRNPHFDFIDVIDEDSVVIFDFGGMEERVKRALTLVLLSNMWSALKARAEAPDTPPNPPQVNLYLEEAKDVAATQLVDTLLSQGRSFGLSIMLGVQFPSQLDSPDPSNQTYEEALNEIGTLVVGNVSIEDDLAKTLATDDVQPHKVARRLAAIRHGEWLIRPAAEFGAPPARPFLGRSLAPPRGHPASDEPLTGEQKRAFDAAFESITLETWRRSGLGHESEPTQATHTDSLDDSDGDESGHDESSLRVDSLLPHTKRFPDCVVYDEAIDALCCGECENRYDPTIEGMKRAIECCHSLEDVDADDIPVCEINLKLTPAEREASEWSDRQLLFLQAVYNAQQLRYDPLEYDILSDSMLRLQEYVGIDNDDITPLLDADVLRHDTDHPHRLYTVSSDGRDAIGESYRRGVDYGHGAGDLEESSQHVFGIEVTRQYLEAAYAQSADSSVTEVIPYYDLDDQHRLDLAGVDADGEIVVTAEVERINNDYHRAVPEDFDKMASCEPEEAIWVVMRQADGHKVLSALNDPLEGEPRVEKTYAKTTPPQQFRIDTPGMTAVYPADWLREQY